MEIDIVALVLDVGKLTEQFVANPTLTTVHNHCQVVVIFYRPYAVNTTHAGDDDDISPGQQCVGSRVTKSIDLFVDLGVFFYIGVRPGNIGLGLIIVKVADKIVHSIVGEEFFELRVELGSQGLVVTEHQRGLL